MEENPATVFAMKRPIHIRFIWRPLQGTYDGLKKESKS